MPILEDDPEVVLAFEILSGERPLDRSKDNTALLKHHRAVLRAAMDRAWEKTAKNVLLLLGSEQHKDRHSTAPDKQQTA